MQRHCARVVYMRLTHQEWTPISELARLRNITVVELLREQLRLSPLDSEPLNEPTRSRHLSAVQPTPAA
jgi:hypothetical protein